MTRWILASASPRRRELLHQMGLEFEVIPSHNLESSDKTNPGEFVMDLAANKACDIFEQAVLPTFWEREEDKACVIGADTIVVCDGEILGKPKDREDAARMIRLLQGREHEVLTGVAVVWADKGSDGVNGQPAYMTAFSIETTVYVNPMEEAEIAAYLATGEADDKAGAYGIQGAFGIYIDGIAGDYYNVVGLPISALYRTLKENGLLE